eukprot:1392515-Amorphochlora_amoeboformis.AAC.2
MLYARILPIWSWTPYRLYLYFPEAAWASLHWSHHPNNPSRKLSLTPILPHSRVSRGMLRTQRA